MNKVSKWMIAPIFVCVSGAAMAGSSGPITASNVLGHTSSSVAGNPISFSISGSGASVKCFDDCDLTASNSKVTTDKTPPVGTNVPKGSGTPHILGRILITNLGSAQGVGRPTPGVGILTTSPGPIVLPVGTTISNSAVRAPEIDPTTAVSGLTLLLGTLAVLRGRRVVPARG